jgi:hypothetical protein
LGSCAGFGGHDDGVGTGWGAVGIRGGVGVGVVELPPPQAQSARASSGAKRQRSLGDGWKEAAFTRTRHPRMASAQSHGVGPVGNNQTWERAVVGTLTLKEEAVVALRVTVAGTEQVAPVGAPEQ